MVQLPIYQLLAPLPTVLFPSYAQCQNDIGRLRGLFLNSFLIVGVILFSVSIGLIPAANAAVKVLLGNQWLGSIQIMQVWCIFMPVDYCHRYCCHAM